MFFEITKSVYYIYTIARGRCRILFLVLIYLYPNYCVREGTVLVTLSMCMLTLFETIFSEGFC